MLNPTEEAKFAELKKMSAELHIPAPTEIFIHLQVHDKGGKISFDDFQRGHSWVRNAYNVAFSHWSNCGGDGNGTFGAGYMSSKRYAGSIDKTTTAPCGAGLSTASDDNGYQAAGDATTSGVLVGNTDTAWSAEQYALAGLIADGTGSGQLSYGTCVVGAPGYTAGTKTWAVAIARNFTNNYSTTTTVKETGLVFSTGNNMHFFLSTYNGSIYNMMERTVLGTAVDVAAGKILTVTYTISMSFSAID